MELRLYWAILRRFWPLALGLPLAVAMVSLVAALLRPPSYGAGARILVNRSADFGPGAGLTPDGEDKTALDVPAIVAGEPFRRDLAEALAQQGIEIGQVAPPGAMSATANQRVVTLASRAGDPATAAALSAAGVDLLKTNGLRYWADPRATPERPGLDVAVLESPGAAVRLNGPRAIAAEVGLRTLLGIAAGCALAFCLSYIRAVGAGPDSRPRLPESEGARERSSTEIVG